MKQDDYILTFVSGLLTVKEQQFVPALKHFGQKVLVDALKVPNHVSVAAQTQNGMYITLTGWLAVMRAGVSGTRILKINPDNGLSPEMAAAFQNGIEKILEIETPSGVQRFALTAQYSSRYQITPAEFVQLLKAQKDPTFYLNKVVDEINRSNELNNRPQISVNELTTYLQSSEGASHFNMSGGDLFREIQVEALTFDKDFKIPDAMKALFMPVEDDGFGSRSEDQVFLYPIADFGANQILELIQAQGITEAFWKHCETKAKNPSEFATPLPDIKAKDWPNHLQQLPDEEMKSLSHQLLRELCEVCTANKIQPKIPKDLGTVFGPDETESRRIKFRLALQSTTGWMLAFQTTPWQMMVFEPVHFDLDSTTAEKSDKNSAANKAEFETVLKSLEAFATKHQSPWSEAFKMARFFSEKAVGEPLDLKDIENIPHLLKSAGLSERALSVFQQEAFLIEDCAAFGWNKAKAYGLISVSIADVFGGMGSWNDQMFEGADHTEYEKLSSKLFSVLQARQTDLISVRLSH